MLVISIILVNLALIIYTVPIFSMLKRKTILKWHTIMFCVGFIFDISSTIIMYKIGGSKLRLGLHDVFGYTALLLMLINAVGSVFILKKYSHLISRFYKFSIFAWLIWIASYILGILSHI